MLVSCVKLTTEPLGRRTHRTALYVSNKKNMVENMMYSPCNWVRVRDMMSNATFNNSSVILWRSVLLVEETGENHRPAASHWQTLSHIFMSGIRTHNFIMELHHICSRRQCLNGHHKIHTLIDWCLTPTWIIYILKAKYIMNDESLK